MAEDRFNSKHLDKLNNPERLKDFPVENIIKLAKIDNPETIIDMGAGTGFFSIPFSEIISDCKIYACDVSDTMISWMNENVANKYDNIYPTKMEDNTVPLNDGIADLLFMVNLHHELDDPIKILRESSRLLKPNGKILISDWRKEESDRGPSIDIRSSTDIVEKQLIETGFREITIHTNFPNNFLIIGKRKGYGQ